MTIRLIITGGTIDKSYNMHNGELHFVDTHIPAMLSVGRCAVNPAIQTLMLKDSLDMQDADRSLILQACQESEENRLIITHGTDTMVTTAKYLQQHLQNKTVVLLGAMIPFVFKHSDALFNLGGAFAAAGVLPEGIYICMNGRIFAADEVTKNRQLGEFQPLS